MAGELPIIRDQQPDSALPTSPSVATPRVLSPEEMVDRERTAWAQIRTDATERYQEYRDERTPEQDRAEMEQLSLPQQQDAQGSTQAEYEATFSQATTVSVSTPITVDWEPEIEEWARIRARASQRYQEYQDERNREQDRAGQEMLTLHQQQEAHENTQGELEAISTMATTASVGAQIIAGWEREIRESAQVRTQVRQRYQRNQLERGRGHRAEDGGHLSILREQQGPRNPSKLRMVHNWLNEGHLWCV